MLPRRNSKINTQSPPLTSTKVDNRFSDLKSFVENKSDTLEVHFQQVECQIKTQRYELVELIKKMEFSGNSVI